MTTSGEALVVHWPLLRGATPFSLLSFLPCNVPTWEEIDDTIDALARQDSEPRPRRRPWREPVEPKRPRQPLPRLHFLEPREPRCEHMYIAKSDSMAQCRWCGRVVTYKAAAK